MERGCDREQKSADIRRPWLRFRSNRQTSKRQTNWFNLNFQFCCLNQSIHSHTRTRIHRHTRPTLPILYSVTFNPTHSYAISSFAIYIPVNSVWVCLCRQCLLYLIMIFCVRQSFVTTIFRQRWMHVVHFGSKLSHNTHIKCSIPSILSSDPMCDHVIGCLFFFLHRKIGTFFSRFLFFCRSWLIHFDRFFLEFFSPFICRLNFTSRKCNVSSAPDDWRTEIKMI